MTKRLNFSDTNGQTKREKDLQKFLLKTTVFQNTRDLPLIRNPHYEYPIQLYGDYKSIIDHLAPRLMYKIRPETYMADFYFDTNSHDLVGRGIFARLRFYVNNEKQIWSVRTIATLDLQEQRKLLARGISVKTETVYLNRVDKDFENYYKFLSDRLTKYRLTGFIYKKRTEFEVFPWKHVRSNIVGKTMSKTWANFYIDEVEVYQVKDSNLHLKVLKSNPKTLKDLLQITKSQKKLSKERQSCSIRGGIKSK